jgi:hypothetical protein
MLLMVDLLIPWRWAIKRQLQWLCPLGLVCKVASITAFNRSLP